MFDMNNIDEETMSQERRKLTLASAFIDRAKDAGIPKQQIGINRDTFKSLLYNGYHGDNGTQKISDFIYDKPQSLMKIPFVLIDGGEINLRKRAGFAILFRLITLDHFGLYRDCSDLIHKFEVSKFDDVLSRSDLTDELKQYKILFISEVIRSQFNPHFYGGSYFDDILNHRIDNGKPTIISFTEKLKDNGDKDNIMDSNISCGRFLNDIIKRKYSQKKNPDDIYLRLRVGEGI